MPFKSPEKRRAYQRERYAEEKKRKTALMKRFDYLSIKFNLRGLTDSEREEMRSLEVILESELNKRRDKEKRRQHREDTE